MLAEEMESSGRGTIMHDGWSKYGTHFLALMGIYVVKTKVKGSSNSKDSFVEETKIVLLSVSPVLRPGLPDHVDHDLDQPNPLVVTQNSEAMLHHVISILKDYYNVDWNWVMAIHSDRAAVCCCMANLGKKPMIGCKNHAWDHDVNEMFNSNNGLSSCQEDCHSCQVGLKQSVKKRSLLSEFTNLNPTIKNDTRWNGMYSCMKKQERMAPSLQLLETSGRVSEEFNQQSDSMFSPDVLLAGFNNALKNYNKDLAKVHTCTSKLQTRLMPFNVSNVIMNMITDAVNNSNNSDIQIGRLHSGQQSAKRTSPDFEAGIFKIQEGKKAELLECERYACRHVLVNAVEDNTAPAANVDDYLESLKKKPRLEDNDYGNVSIFLGSCAEVERVWSFAKFILTNTQANMTPLMFETVLFLKYNWSYVTLDMVQRAITDVRTENFNTRRSKTDTEQEQLHSQVENN